MGLSYINMFTRFKITNITKEQLYHYRYIKIIIIYNYTYILSESLIINSFPT